MADYYGGRTMYSNTDECYDDVDRRRPVAYADDCYDGARQTAVYSDEYSRGGYGGEQQYYKREEKEHKHRERLGEAGALAGGAFALYEGHRAKKDPEQQAEAHDRGRPGGRGGAGRRRLRLPRAPRAEGGPLRGQRAQGAARLLLQLRPSPAGAHASRTHAAITYISCRC